MANNSANIAKNARLLAFAHILLGFLLFCFGVAERALELWLTDACFGIWIGIWMCITGGVGVPGSSRDKTTTQRVLACVFMGFSITSAFFGVIIVVFYSMALGDETGHTGGSDYDSRMAIGAVILSLGVAEFAVGVWAAVCCFWMEPCTASTCCVVSRRPEGRPLGDSFICEFTSDGYIIFKGPNGVPQLIPVQSGSSVIAVQASVVHGVQPTKFLVPTTNVQAGDLRQPGFVSVAGRMQADDCAFVGQSSTSDVQ